MFHDYLLTRIEVVSCLAAVKDARRIAADTRLQPVPMSIVGCLIGAGYGHPSWRPDKYPVLCLFISCTVN